MKNLILMLLLTGSVKLYAQDVTPITVDVRNNAKLQFNGSAVKMKAVVIYYHPVHDGSKDFVIRLSLQMYENNAGSYGSRIVTIIQNDVTLSEEERADLLDRYRDREITYTTAGKWVDANGNIVTQNTPGAITELAYWQGFKLNHASLGMTSASTQGALDAEYKIVKAIILKLDSRKNF